MTEIACSCQLGRVDGIGKDGSIHTALHQYRGSALGTHTRAHRRQFGHILVLPFQTAPFLRAQVHAESVAMHIALGRGGGRRKAAHHIQPGAPGIALDGYYGLDAGITRHLAHLLPSLAVGPFQPVHVKVGHAVRLTAGHIHITVPEGSTQIVQSLGQRGEEGPGTTVEVPL